MLALNRVSRADRPLNKRDASEQNSSTSHSAFACAREETLIKFSSELHTNEWSSDGKTMTEEDRSSENQPPSSYRLHANNSGGTPTRLNGLWRATAQTVGGAPAHPPGSPRGEQRRRRTRGLPCPLALGSPSSEPRYLFREGARGSIGMGTSSLSTDSSLSWTRSKAPPYKLRPWTGPLYVANACLERKEP